MPLKPVIILDETLPPRLKANFSASLGRSMGRLRPDLSGADRRTQDGELLAAPRRAVDRICVRLPVLR